ncbi:testis-expressed protein 13D [Sorex fumeus]|uniref:testis-expressed protein 13D n=1 Tax=Sorex fumeus TaxID=62283 RepID=UPI0024ADD22F|nr:testis-expressed protein 13D [Sorex fumeus]
MSIESGDQGSGFRHHEVVQFINNEVHANGGGRDIYTTFRSRSWNEVEDCLQTVVADPQVPHNVKQACTWSGLALNVRFAAQQQEQQAQRVQLLQAQIEESQATTWALATELQQVRGDCEAMAAQLHFTGLTLQQVLWERDALHARLLHERMARRASFIPDEPVSQADQPEMTPWQTNAEQRGDYCTEIHSSSYFEDPLPTMLYVPGPLTLWASLMQTPMLMPIPWPFLCPTVFSTQVPFLAPPLSVVMETEPTFAPLQIPTPLGIYPAGPWASMGAQNDMVSLWDQGNYEPEEESCTYQHPGTLEDSTIQFQQNPDQSQAFFEENCCHIQTDGAENTQQVPPSGDDTWDLSRRNQERNQGLTPLEDCCHHHQEGDSEKTQKVDTMGENIHFLCESPERPQALTPQRCIVIHSHEEDIEASQSPFLVEDSGTQNQEKGIDEPQELPPLKDNRTQDQEDNLEQPHRNTLLGARKKHMKQQIPDLEQETGPLTDIRSNQEESSKHVQCSSNPKAIPLRGNQSKNTQEKTSNKSQGSKKNRKKQQAQGLRAKQFKGKKRVSESQNQDRCVLTFLSFKLELSRV